MLRIGSIITRIPYTIAYTTSSHDSPRIPPLITIRTYPRLYIVYIIPRPIVTAGIVNLSETPCTAQTYPLFVRDSKSQQLAHAAHSSTSEERSSPDTSASEITAKSRRRPTYRRPASEPPAKSRRRPTHSRPSPEPPAEAGRRPAYRRPTPDITAKSGPRRTRRRLASQQSQLRA